MKHLLFIIGLFFCVELCFGHILYVKPNETSNSWSGKTQVYVNLQNAIDESNEGDSIWVASGTYFPTKFINGKDDKVYYSFSINKGIKLFGGFKGDENKITDRRMVDLNKNDEIEQWEFENTSILSGDHNKNDKWTRGINGDNYSWNIKNNGENSQHVIYFDNSHATDNNSIDFEINGFSISGGNASLTNNYFGGAIFYHSEKKGELKIINNSIKNNYSKDSGGAIYIYLQAKDSCKVSILSNEIIQNASDVGGNINLETNFILPNSEITIDNNIISDNSGDVGGINLKFSSPTNLTIKNNSIISNGKHNNSQGGICLTTNTDKSFSGLIYNNYLDSNKGNYGGGIGIFFREGKNRLTIKNNQLINNLSLYKGGGIYISKESIGEIEIENNRINSNQTISSDGGGIFIDANNSTVIVKSNFICNNSSGNAQYGFKYGGGIACFTYLSCINNLISNNQAQVGGGVYIDNGKLINNTIAYNVGSGISIPQDKAAYILNNLIVNNSTGSTLNTISASSSNNLIGNYDIFLTPPSFKGVSSTVNQKDELDSVDFRLKMGSVAIDGGKSDTSNLHLPQLDLLGIKRVLGKCIDIGAFEYDGQSNNTSQFKKEAVKLFPNPIGNFVRIEWNDTYNFLEIFSLNGQYITSKQIVSSPNIIDLSDLSFGIYIFTFSNDSNERYTCKVIKK